MFRLKLQVESNLFFNHGERREDAENTEKKS